ncbi:hypothetical protein ACWENQ_41005 [Nonomuraea sp. NPDC004354]
MSGTSSERGPACWRGAARGQGRMHATVRELAGDRYAGRRVGSPGGRAAAF